MIDQQKASELARAGFDLWQAGQLEESASKYREALECADPSHYALEDYHGEFAAVLAALGRDAEARKQYELALAKAERGHQSADEPGVIVARYFLGEHLLKMSDAAAALETVHAEAGVSSTPSVDSGKPATDRQFKTGHHERAAETSEFYFVPFSARKSVCSFVRQLRGPHLSTCA